MSFSSYQGASVEFAYNCVTDKTTVDASNDIHKQPEITTNDISEFPLEGKLGAKSNHRFDVINFVPNLCIIEFSFLLTACCAELVKKCETEETWELQYNKFHALKDIKNSQADGYVFKLNFFIFGHKEVHVLLSPTDKPNIENGYTKDQSAYEVIVGGYGGARHVIRKTVEDDDLFEKVQLKDLVSEEKQTRVLIQLRNGLCDFFIFFALLLRYECSIFTTLFLTLFLANLDGLLEVFVGEFQYKPFIKAFAKPIDVKYVSFASSDGNRVLYFYNCEDAKAAKSILPLPATDAHPLFAEPTETNEENLTKKCKHSHAWEDVYSTPVKLDSIKNSSPDGYVVRVPVLVKGVRDAHILLTSGNSANPSDGYEIGKNKKTLLQNTQTQQTVFNVNIS